MSVMIRTIKFTIGTRVPAAVSDTFTENQYGGKFPVVRGGITACNFYLIPIKYSWNTRIDEAAFRRLIHIPINGPISCHLRMNQGGIK